MNFVGNTYDVTLDTCSEEPIHIPGAIQPHGVLFVLSEPDLTVLQASANAKDFIGRSVEEVLGERVGSLLSSGQVAAVVDALGNTDPRESNPVRIEFSKANDGSPLDAAVHRHKGFSFLELEPAAPSAKSHFTQFYKNVSRLTQQMQATTNIGELLNVCVRGIRILTGFDRVWIYEMQPNLDIYIAAEDGLPRLESFLDFFFPASDIPMQARQLYLLNSIRAIADVNYVPVPIQPLVNPKNHQLTDMSLAELRSVSPIHIEYLKNMEVMASMSVSIIVNGKLWGLIACHHYEGPRFLNYELRKACTFLAQVLSTEIGKRKMEDEYESRTKGARIQAELLVRMSESEDKLKGLLSGKPNLLDVVPADGAVLWSGGECTSVGKIPPVNRIAAIIEWLGRKNLKKLAAYSALREAELSFEDIRQTASGLLAIQVSHKDKCHLLWFRPEVAQTVKWAGDPEKAVIADFEGKRLTPRKSFQLWKQNVEGKCIEWKAHELEAAENLGKMVKVVFGSKMRSQ